MISFLRKMLVGIVSMLCLAFVCLGVNVLTIAQAADTQVISSSVNQIEVFSSDKTVIVHLSEADYITSPLPNEITDVSQYKWTDFLLYRDRENYNVYNAGLDSRLNEYNYLDNIFIDGVALREYAHFLMANKFQRVNGLGISFSDDVLTNATEIEIKAGCTLPTLARSYFGLTEKSQILIEEDILFRENDGVWTRSYRFDGYELGVEYDATEQYLYKRNPDGNYKGYAEAPTCEFTNAMFKEEALGVEGYDAGYALVSSPATDKGNLLIVQFVNPIDVSVFGTIHLDMYVHRNRSMVTYNASGVTEDSLGEKLEMFNVVPSKWVRVSLFSALYADENGMVDTLVFQFTNDGDEDSTWNQVCIGRFSLGESSIEGLVYEKSLLMDEQEDYYDFIFRFNKKGEFLNEWLDTSKVLFNGLSIDEINADGAYATAKWVSIQGIYQINLRLLKTYTGEAQVKNAEYEYSGNKMSVLKGLTFPNGDVLDKSYTYNCYRTFTDNGVFENEVFISSEADVQYAETQAESVTWELNADGNLRISVRFDKMITTKALFHTCELEVWRQALLEPQDRYEHGFSEIFVKGGYKSSLMDSVVINGLSIGDIHAINNHQTCVFVHYGTYSNYGFEIYVNQGTKIFNTLKPLFEAGNGVTVEIKEGLLFTTNYKTTKDCVFNLKDGAFRPYDQKQVSVYFDGQLVEDGVVVDADYEALESHVYVDGVDGYEVTKTTEGDKATFMVTYDGTTMVFHVQQTIVQSPDIAPKDSSNDNEGGCTSTLAVGAVATAMVLAGAWMIRRKQDA